MTWTGDEREIIVGIQQDVTAIKIALKGYAGQDGLIRQVERQGKEITTLQRAQSEDAGARKNDGAWRMLLIGALGGLVGFLPWVLDRVWPK